MDKTVIDANRMSFICYMAHLFSDDILSWDMYL